LCPWISCLLQPEHITKGYVPRLANARLPGSYINHYCANGGAVVPQFGYPTDQQAIDVLQKAYGPGYKVVGVPGGTREVLLNAGEIDCSRFSGGAVGAYAAGSADVSMVITSLTRHGQQSVAITVVTSLASTCQSADGGQSVQTVNGTDYCGSC
jgi:hypothetical protein